jgi:hypothetical protein
MKNINKKIKSKVIYIDVGVHKGTEVDVLNKRYLLWFIFLYAKRFLISIYLRKIIIPSIYQFFLFLKIKRELHQKMSKTNQVGVEPNWRMYGYKNYKYFNQVFPLALVDEKKGINFGKLYHSEKTLNGEGASVFEGNQNDFDTVIYCSADSFMKTIFETADNNIEKMILRINCEGCEDDVIYAAIKAMEGRPLLVLGSLKDVREKKGEVIYRKLIDEMQSKNILFEKFSGDMRTWVNASRVVNEFI